MTVGKLLFIEVPLFDSDVFKDDRFLPRRPLRRKGISAGIASDDSISVELSTVSSDAKILPRRRLVLDISDVIVSDFNPSDKSLVAWLLFTWATYDSSELAKDVEFLLVFVSDDVSCCIETVSFCTVTTSSTGNFSIAVGTSNIVVSDIADSAASTDFTTLLLLVITSSACTSCPEKRTIPSKTEQTPMEYFLNE